MRIDDVVIGDLYHVNPYDFRAPCRAVGTAYAGHTTGTGARTRVVQLQRCDRDGNPVDDDLLDAPARDLTPWADWWEANQGHVHRHEAARRAAADLDESLTAAGTPARHVGATGSRVTVHLDADVAARLADLVAAAALAAEA